MPDKFELVFHGPGAEEAVKTFQDVDGRTRHAALGFMQVAQMLREHEAKQFEPEGRWASGGWAKIDKNTKDKKAPSWTESDDSSGD